MRKFRKNQRIEIDWIDTVQDPSWKSEEKARQRPDCDCITIGYYLKHDKELLYVSQTISGKQRDITTIPIGCIKKNPRILCVK